MDRIPELNQPDWMKYLKPYILQKYETSVNQLDADWQNDPAAAVILETSEEDYVGSGEEQGSGIYTVIAIERELQYDLRLLNRTRS